MYTIQEIKKAELKKFNKSKKTFVRNLFGLRLNGFGANLYTNLNGAAAIIFDHNLNTVKTAGIFFSNITEAETYLKRFRSDSASNLNRLLIIADIFNDDEFDYTI